jgi:5-methylcytosine-specific restriction endonuclease McrA
MIISKLCECNCGQYAKPGNRFILGHNTKGKKNLTLSERNKKRNMKGENNPMFGNKNPIRSEMNKQNVGEKNPCFKRKHTEDELRNLSKLNKGKKRPYVSERNKKLVGNKNPIFGKKGELSPNWKGGISFELYGLGFNKELKKYIREKFNHTCVLCGEFAKIPHHIDYNKRNNQEDNFVLLCNSCNSKVNKNRIQWEIYFRSYILRLKEE